MNLNQLKNLLEHLVFEDSIDINLKEVHYKNGKIMDKRFELIIDYNQLAFEIENYLEENNYTIIKTQSDEIK